MLGAAVIVSAAGSPVCAQNSHEKPVELHNTYGEIGLLDMPSARMAEDGELSFSFGQIGSSQRYTLSFQALPWLEGSFRYARVGHWFDDPHYYDRSFGVKLRLLKEDDWLPDLSVGARDIVGSGVYSAEYLAASKKLGSLDVTAGLGWGRLAGNTVLNNTIGLVFKSFNTRPGANSGAAGAFDVGNLFHGPKLGVFGGLVWQTPMEGLSVVAEYSSDDYVGEGVSGELNVRSPVNIGLAFRPSESFSFSAGWLYGTTYGVTATLIGQPTIEYPSAIRLGAKVPPPAIRSEADQRSALVTMRGDNFVHLPTTSERYRQNLLQAFLSEADGVRDVEIQEHSLLIDARLTSDPSARCAVFAKIAANFNTPRTLAITDLQSPEGRVFFCQADHVALAGSPHGSEDKIRSAADTSKYEKKLETLLTAQGIQFDAVRTNPSELWIYYENYHYRNQSEAAGRIARILLAEAPPSVEVFHIISSPLGVPSREITVFRSALERALANSEKVAEADSTVSISLPPVDNPILDEATSRNYPRFAWVIDPKATQHLFDPADPIQFMIFAQTTGMLQFSPGFALSAELTGTVWTNYTYTRDPGSDLPHVRTDLLRYEDKGKYGIASLQLNYRRRLSQEITAEVRGGILEDMFAGAGAQVIWRPEGSRFTFGGDVYKVWQRDYNRLFGTRAYSVITGHVSVYYESPFYDLTYAAHFGRYLAGDDGGTLEVKRRFSSGVEIGVWATLTNVPFSRFGEGSFDKGIIIHIPLEWGLPIWSQTSYDLHLSPLTRDGGQRLAGDDSLYVATQGVSFGEAAGHIDDVVNP